MKYLFLDTNIFIHYVDFEEIDWRRLLSIDEFCIVVVPKVIEEIEKIKDSEKGKKQRKAKAISSKLGDIFLSDVKFKVNVITCNEPLESSFDGLAFQKSIADHSILLSTLEFACDKEDKIIIAADNPLLIKAKSLGIPFSKMTDEYLLKEELSDEEKEIQELKKKLHTYESRVPKPVILFNNNQSLLRIKRPVKIDVESLVKERMNEYSIKYPFKESYSPYDMDLIGYTNSKGFSMGSGAVAEYNKELTEYLNKIQTVIYEEELFKTYSSYMHPINFILSNADGTDQTGDTIIFINFPDNISLYDKDSITDISVRIPKEPSKIVPIDNVLRGGSYDGSSYKDVKKWEIEDTLNSEQKMIKKNINHGVSINLDFGQLYINAFECESFAIKYSIHDSKLITPVNGTLNVIIEE